MASITLTRIHVSKEELQKLSTQDYRDFIMMMLIDRDLGHLAKLLAVSSSTKPVGPTEKSAYVNITLIPLIQIMAKSYEAHSFLLSRFPSIFDSPSGDDQKVAAEKLRSLSEILETKKVYQFARNRFTFHYDHDAHPAFFSALDEARGRIEGAVVYLSPTRCDSVYSYANQVMLDVLLSADSSTNQSAGLLGEKYIVGLSGLIDDALKMSQLIHEIVSTLLADQFLQKMQYTESEVDVAGQNISEGLLPLFVTR